MPLSLPMSLIQGVRGMPMPGHFSCPLLGEILHSCAQAMTLCTWRVCLRTAQKLRCARLQNGLILDHGANDHNRCSPQKRACLLFPVCCLDHMFGSVSGKSAEWQRSTCGAQHILEQCCPAATCHAQKHDAACKYFPKFFQLIPRCSFLGVIKFACMGCIPRKLSISAMQI
jgi:hypothetical protein